MGKDLRFHFEHLCRAIEFVTAYAENEVGALCEMMDIGREGKDELDLENLDED